MEDAQPQRRRPHQDGPTLLSLPNIVLESIASHLGLLQRVAVLPLVCRELSALLRRPSPVLWREVTVLLDFTQPQDTARARCLARWLLPRAGGVRRLELTLVSAWGMLPAGGTLEVWPDLRAALAAVMPGCEFLKLALPGILEVDAWISWAFKLETAALMGDAVVFKVPLSGLPALRTLELGSLTQEGLAPPPPRWLPRQLERLTLIPAYQGAIPPQVLALPELVHLDISETFFEPGVLSAALPFLTQLTSLALDETNNDLPHQLSLLTNLRVLSLDSCQSLGDRLREPACPLTALRRLASLSLSGNKLLAFPPSLTGMTSLENLYLENNTFWRLGAGPYLSRLHVLCLDWDTALHSLPQLAAATVLRELALGRPAVPMHQPPPLVAGEWPPTAADMLRVLGAMPTLRDVVVLAEFLGAPSVEQLEVLLGLRTCRPGGVLEVRSVRRFEYFVADPGELEPAGEPRQEAARPGA